MSNTPPSKPWGEQSVGTTRSPAARLDLSAFKLLYKSHGNGRKGASPEVNREQSLKGGQGNASSPLPKVGPVIYNSPHWEGDWIDV